ncbi:MAG: DUF4350 domain-containing protein [Sporichthyaceae bacterium]
MTVRSRTRASSLRLPAIALTVLLVVSISLALLSARGTAGRLDPESYEPDGSRALAQLLRAEGVRITVARTLAQAVSATTTSSATTTVLITDPALVPAGGLRELAALATELVLVAPDQVAPDELVELDEAAATVLDTPRQLTNAGLDIGDNAAASLSLLGKHPGLIWYRPGLDDPQLQAAGAGRPLHVLLPGPVKLMGLQIFLGLAMIALWRGRRLGPVVTEPLPVVVRASEATEGLARLYRSTGARGRAATAVRAGALRTIGPRFGLPSHGADPPTLTAAVAAHTHAPAAEIDAVLYGGAPTDDGALVALADDLDLLLRQVRRP